MLPTHPSPDMDFGAALDGSACLGAWTHDIRVERFSVSPSLGQSLGLRDEEAADLSSAAMISAIHAEDGPRIESLFAAFREMGGPFEAEFRTRDGGRWLRMMGRMDRDGSRFATRACGLAFDLTEGRLGRGGPARRAQWQANQLAEHVIAMKGLVPRLENPSLARLVDRLAVKIGFELARRLVPAAGAARQH